jgi:hypothetical protein
MLFLFILVAISFITLIIAGIRYISIATIFNDNQEAQAVINHISFFRDRGNIFFEFIYQGEKYGARLHVMRNNFTTRYKIGDQVIILVDRNQPKKAFIKELFQ